MTATVSSRAVAFLSRAALLAGMLAIIAGILGMHIMTGSHAAASPASGAGPAMPEVMQAYTGTNSAPGSAGVQSTQAEQDTGSMAERSCAEPGSCMTMSAMDAVCIPSPGNAPFSAPLPATTPFEARAASDIGVPITTYPYLPGSPSPGELCISRT